MASPPSAAAAEAAASAALDSSKATTDPASSMDLSSSNADAWQKCLDNAVNAIVNIRVLQVKPFEATGSSSSYATGFVVNLEHNLILTNRHVVGCGAPAVMDALLHNKEEIDLSLLYVDPVHDFAILRYDQSAIKYQKLTEIELDPEGARVGREIRVIGNDSGEKIQILPGIIARTDRDAPYYGYGYNDWNTWYISAASSTSGGSSGSPVLAQDGRAVALNCGAAKHAASSFYLPLARVKRALDLVIAHLEGLKAAQAAAPVPTSKIVPRGTVQIIFKYKAFDELRRLGLSSEAETQARAAFPDETGMLVVDQVLPEGPGAGQLEPGDILLGIGADEAELELIATFVPLEEQLDSRVGGRVVLRTQRGGAERVLTLDVQDLHALVPTKLLAISSAILHEVTLHIGKAYNLPAAKAVYLSATGYMFSRAGINIHCILLSVNGQPTPTLVALARVFQSLPDGARTSATFHALTDRHRVRTAVITVDKRWFPFGHFCLTRNAKNQCLTWDFEPAAALEPEESKDSGSGSGSSSGSTAAVPAERPMSPATIHPRPPARLRDSLVMVSFDCPYLIDGVSSGEYIGAGVVVDKALGLVLVDRATAPITLGDALITFGGCLEVKARVVFVHPMQNFSILQYDAQELAAVNGGDGEEGLVAVAEAEFVEEGAGEIKVGDSLVFHGLNPPAIHITQRLTVTKKETLKLGDGRPPMFVGGNTTAIHFDHSPSTNGIFEAADGKVAALRLCYMFQHDGEAKQVYRSVPAEIVVDTLSALKASGGKVPEAIPVLPLKFTQVSLSKAKSGMGLSPGQFKRLVRAIHETQHEASLLMVRRVAAGSPLATALKTGDVLLSVNGRPVVRPHEVEIAVRASALEGDGQVTFEVLRDHAEVALPPVAVGALSTLGTDRLVNWAGLLLQEPHLPVAMLGYLPAGIYVSRWSYGSPAHKYGLRASFFITELDGVPTPTLDAFLHAVTGAKKGCGDAAGADGGAADAHGAVRVKGFDLDGKPRAYSLKPVPRYWPTSEVRWSREKLVWQMVKHTDPEPASA